MLNSQQAAHFLNRDLHDVRRLAKVGILPSVMIKHKLMFDIQQLTQWMIDNPKQTHKLTLSDADLVWLSHQYTNTKIAAMFNVVPSAISYRLRKLGINRYNKDG